MDVFREFAKSLNGPGIPCNIYTTVILGMITVSKIFFAEATTRSVNTKAYNDSKIWFYKKLSPVVYVAVILYFRSLIQTDSPQSNMPIKCTIVLHESFHNLTVTVTGKRSSNYRLLLSCNRKRQKV